MLMFPEGQDGKRGAEAEEDSKWKWALGAWREPCPGARGQVDIYTGFPGASRDSEPSPEAENSDDNDHQDQHHAHDRSACNQGQLLPPALTLWGRKKRDQET